jgi:hypothetical protein
MVDDHVDLLMDTVTKHYLSSSDFNGITLDALSEELAFANTDLIDFVIPLIEDDRLGIVFPSTDVNPHILRVSVEAPEDQIEILKEYDHQYAAYVYPRPKHLSVVVDTDKYSGRPFLLELALGEAQLAFRSFDLSVLEHYRNDPRYTYSNDGVRGSISISSDFYDSDEMAEEDKILLQSFGFSYDDDLNRAVAVFLRDLSRLSEEHQQVWKARQLDGKYRLHPDYYRNMVVGDWGKGISIFNAFLLELQTINKMSVDMDRQPLYRNDFGDRQPPRGFSFLIRPTKKEYYDFVLLIDKLMSQNLNQNFFQNEVPYEIEEELPDGRLAVRRKGTIQILEDWPTKFFRPRDTQPLADMISAFRKIRKLRQRPAHALEDNNFDQIYIHQQRELMVEAYSAVRTIRLIFQNHPKLIDFEVPQILDGEIWIQ